MQFDDLLQRYFATTELSEISPDTLAAGIEHCRVDLGLERDPGKRFSLWAMLYMLDAAPALDVAFEDEEDREAARNFMDLMAASQERDGADPEQSSP
ncbi:MAG: hypothetical protein COW16_08615 [Sphingomonadales bacterium CG12_big_fil_rev_8_21_14_0_65_65_10]|nr:MAG: hypothetical protein COW16_08615 [Sphingomonadales bacterium CG12_big_fil_rev_8_21_14_0_65_65_10]